MVSGDLVWCRYGFKSMQLHAEVPVAMTDIVATNPAVAALSPFWFGVMSISHAGMPTVAPARLVRHRRRAPGDRRAGPEGEPLQAA